MKQLKGLESFTRKSRNDIGLEIQIENRQQRFFLQMSRLGKEIPETMEPELQRLFQEHWFPVFLISPLRLRVFVFKMKDARREIGSICW